jgi:predicted PurR-regulated permease PerM
MSQPPVNPFWDFFNTSRLVRYLLLFALGWAIIQLLAYFETVIIVFTFATILAFLLNYPVQWLNKYTRHSIAVSVVFLISLILLAGLAATLGLAIFSQAQTLLEQAPDLVQSFLPFLERVETWLEASNIPADLAFLKAELQKQLASLLEVGGAIATGIFANFIDLIFILVVAFFMLLDGERLWRYLVQLFPNSIRSEITTSLKNNFLGFFRGRLILAIFFAISTFFVYLVLQTPYPLVLATIGGLFDLIPGIGATIGVVLVALILLSQSVWLSLQVIVYCILLQQVEENLLMPRVMQDSVNLNPVIVFFALLVGARIAGLLGLFLAIPTAGVIVSLLNLEAMKG